MNTALPITALAACLAIGGCINPENDRITVGTSLRMETFSAPRGAEERVVPPGLTAPSVVSIERDNWQKTEILVPVDGIAHNPTYARRINETDKTRRQRELYPTAASALDLAGSEGQQQREAVYNVFRAVTDIAFLLPRMYRRAPWRTDASPDEAYARSWNPRLPPGQRQPLPEDTDPFAEPSPRSITP